MKRSVEVLDQTRQAMGGHDKWQGELPKLAQLPGGRWRVACGDGRYQHARGNAAIAHSSGVALNFQILGDREAITAYEICATWPQPEGSTAASTAGVSTSWALMFHLHPEAAKWPGHPLYHIQMASSDIATIPPFADWRLPFNEIDPPKLIEFLAAHLT